MNRAMSFRFRLKINIASFLVLRLRQIFFDPTYPKPQCSDGKGDVVMEKFAEGGMKPMRILG
jgi:hypothetical protein